MDQQFDLFVTTLQAFFSEIAIFFPKLMAALLLFLIGWLFARVARAGTERLLRLTQFKSLAERSGLEAMAKSGGIQISFVGAISAIVYWLVLLIAAVSITNSLGLPALSNLINRAVVYLPNVLVAILVLVLGTLLARFVNRLLFVWLNGMKLPNALIISTGGEYAVQVFAFFLALEELSIGTHLLTAAFSIAFGGLVFALALAFGLGGREWAAGRIKAWAEK